MVETVVAGCLLAAVPNPEKVIQLTNKSSKAVCVVLPTLDVGSTDPANQNIYDQSTKLISTIDGKSSIPSGASGSFLLDQSYIDPKTHQTVYNPIYQLIVSDADSFVPMASLGVMQNTSTKPAFADQSVTDADAAAMANAALFFQTIAAYPTAKLTTDYLAAVKGAQSDGAAAADGSPGSAGAVSSAMTKRINAFFAGTKSFQNVTLSNLLVMENYYSALPYAWGGSPTGATYYLYSNDGKVTQFAGTLTLTRPARLDPTKPSGGYTCIYAPASNPADLTSQAVDTTKATNLIYDDGLFVDDVTSDTPQFAIRGTFQVLRLFTQVPTDTKLVRVLTGTVDGTIVIGFDKAQSLNDKDNSEFWNSLFHPKNSAEIFKSVMTIGGAIMFLFFVGQVVYHVVQWARSLKAPTTQQMLDAQQKALEKSFKERMDALEKKLSNGKEKAPDDVDDAANSIAEERAAIADRQNINNLDDGLAAEANNLEIVESYADSLDAAQTTALNDAATTIDTASTAIDGATASTLSSVVDAQTTAFSGIQTQVSSLTDAVSTSVSSTESTQIADNAAISKEASQSIEDSSANEAEDGAADDPILDDPIV